MQQTPPDNGREPRGGLTLLATRRFGPYFVTQLLGAFNDNVFRNALFGIVAFQIAVIADETADSGSLINIAAGLFILPFFLLSALAGQLADKYDKALLIRQLKIAEIAIMLTGGIAIVTGSVPLLLVIVTLMGAQSAFFGPAKYGLLPVHLSVAELTSGNALVQAGTMVAILLGTIAGGLLVDIAGYGRLAVAGLVVVIAVAGWLASRSIPAARPVATDIRIDLNVFRGTWRAIRAATGSRTMLLYVLGISWFWFFGSILIAQLPVYVRDDLHGDQPVATLLLSVFVVGVVAGSILCERFSGRQVEIGLVPIGALGMTVFAVGFAASPWPEAASSVATVLGSPAGRSILLNLFLLALSAGLYIVPLYAAIQSRADTAEVSRIIAFNNIVNALLMVAAAIVAVLLLEAGLTIRQMILTVAAMHVAIVVFIFFEIPEFALRLVFWLITHALYRVRACGLDHIPDRGPAILISNHTSLIDALVITAKCRRPIRFVMYYKIYDAPVLKYLFRMSGAIPIASRKEDPDLLDRAYEEIAATLARGGLVGLFPEGRLTTNGEIGEFRPGIEKMLDRTPVDVIPIALRGLWGTFFTRFEGQPLMRRWPRHWLSVVSIHVGEPVSAAAAELGHLRERVAELFGDGRAVAAQR